MADRYDYDDRERRWRRQNEEGFFGRVRDWFGGNEDEDYEDERDSYNSRDWDQGSSRSRYDINFSRGGDTNRDNWQRDQDYNRSQQWRRGAGRETERYGGQQYNQNRGRDAFGDPYGQNYGTDWDVDRNRGGEDYAWDYGYSRQYNRDWDMDRDRQSGQIYNRDWYDWDFDEDFNDENDTIRNSGYRRDRGYGRTGGYDRSSFNRNRGNLPDYGSRQRFNRGVDDYDQTRDYGRVSDYGQGRNFNPSRDYNRESRYNKPQDYGRNRGYNQESDYNRSRRFNRNQDYNRDQEYGLGRDYDRNPRYGLGRDYGRERGYNRDRDYSGYRLYGLEPEENIDINNPDVGTERNRSYNYNPYGLYGLENTPSRGEVMRTRNEAMGRRNEGMRTRNEYRGGEDQDWSNQYRTAGMRSDYGQRANYENRAFYDENLDFYRGDVGYDDEGAFYQDLDEPINYEYWEVWEIPGPFSGIGPQNFQRTDKRIKEDICERFTNHGRIDASDIDIDVNDGDVTLRGTVPDRNMKRIAEDTAERITGVKNIHNEIKVKKSDWSERGFNRSSEREYGSNRDWTDTSMAGQTNAGSGLTGEGATSLSGMEAATSQDQKRSQLREGMEVIGNTGQVIGRVKEIRASDFLLDRELARDVYVPFSAIKSVGAQVLLNVAHDQVDQQNWEKPNVM